MFQSAHCPESNPIEQVWQYLKKRLHWKSPKTLDELHWKSPKTLDELRELLWEQLLVLMKETIASITGRASILEALSVLGFEDLVLRAQAKWDRQHALFAEAGIEIYSQFD
ncbi:hypothetical protein OLK001_24550 [Synechocystis sp. LKSZ1]